MANVIGYARVSTLDQDPQLQRDALDDAGAIRVFTDHASGSKADRPQLTACLDYLRAGAVSWNSCRPTGPVGRQIERAGGVAGCSSHGFDVARGDVFGRVGVAGDVALGSVSETSFELVGVGIGGLGELEREGVSQVVGS